jgi:hypothetical protein
MKNIILVISLIILSLNLVGQESQNVLSKLKSLTEKGDYILVEVRLNSEDEFRTIEGSSSSLARLALFTGNNQGTEILSKGFDGMNEIVTLLNKLKKNGWRLVDVYPIKGNSLIITHYVLERKK